MTTRLDEIEKRIDAATPGPWRSDSCGDIFTEAETEFCPGMDQHLFRTLASTKCGPDRGDAAFIAHARQDIPHLLNKIDVARAIFDDIRCGRMLMGLDHDEDLHEVIKMAEIGYNLLKE